MNSDVSDSQVGLIGLGLLGGALGRRLVSSGWNVCGFDIDPNARLAFSEAGGATAESPNEIAAACASIILSLPDANIARSVLVELLPQMQNSAGGRVIIDTTTGDPQTMAENAQLAAAAGVGYLDACVAGSSLLAEQGEAILLVGGTAETIQRCDELLRALGCKVFPLDAPGDGAKMKLVTNLVLGLNRAVLAEGLYFAETLGLDCALTLEILAAGPANSAALSAKGEKMQNRDFTPQARLSQHLKDVRLILAAAEKHSAALPLSGQHVKMLGECENAGLGKLDNSAVLQGYLSQIFGSIGSRE